MNQLAIIKTFVGREFTDSPSPFMRWLNPVVLSAEAGALVFRYRIRAEWLNPLGNLHGGVTAAIMDDVIGATMFSLDEDFFYTTINNVIDYFSAATVGELLIAETSVVKQGKQFIHAQCELWNADKSRLIAKGISNLFKTTMRRGDP